MIKLIILSFVLICEEIQSANILAVFPMPSISHQIVFRPLTQELAKRGHQVTVITTDPAFDEGSTPENLNEINVHDVSYETFQRLFGDKFKVGQKIINLSQRRRGNLVLSQIFESQLKTSEVQKLINDDKKFDLILIEVMIRPALIFSHIFKAPVILISSVGAIYYSRSVMGLPTHPLLNPTPLHKRIYNLTLTEKLYEIYEHYITEYALYLNEDDENKMLQQYLGSDIPPLNELYKNVDMLFLNIHPMWANNQPVPTNVVYIGGILQQVEKPLHKDLQQFLDSSKHGVIYLSFGTNVKINMIPSDKIQLIVEVLSNLPYDVLWKWDQNELTEITKNIRISKWFPQPDLLKHPKVKLFITQAGLQSTDEAINAGVPLLGIPMLADQWYNAEQYVKYGIGKVINIESLSAEEFESAIENVIKDESYRRNIKKLRQQILDQPESPLQRAVWWTEYVLRHGGAKHLRSTSANLSYAEYFEIEVVLILLLILLLLLASITLGVIIVYKIFKSLDKSVKKVKQS